MRLDLGGQRSAYQVEAASWPVDLDKEPPPQVKLDDLTPPPRPPPTISLAWWVDGGGGEGDQPGEG